MPQDKFGIEIQVGDVLAMVDTHKDTPAVICVADRGFTPQYTKVSYFYLFGYNSTIHQGRHSTRHLVILNEEQAESLINKIVQKRLEYQQEYSNNVHFVQLTEHDIRERLNELLELSREIKENN